MDYWCISFARGHSIYYMHPLPRIEGPFTIPLGYKNVLTPLDAIFVSYPLGNPINPHWISFPPPLGYENFSFY